MGGRGRSITNKLFITVVFFGFKKDEIMVFRFAVLLLSTIYRGCHSCDEKSKCLKDVRKISAHFVLVFIVFMMVCFVAKINQ